MKEIALARLRFGEVNFVQIHADYLFIFLSFFSFFQKTKVFKDKFFQLQMSWPKPLKQLLKSGRAE